MDFTQKSTHRNTEPGLTENCARCDDPSEEKKEALQKHCIAWVNHGGSVCSG